MQLFSDESMFFFYIFKYWNEVKANKLIVVDKNYKSPSGVISYFFLKVLLI